MTSVRKVRVKSGLRQLQKITRGLRGPDKVKVGFPVGSSDDVLDKAVYNEFGTRNIPERPFMRNGLRDGVPDIKRVSKNVSKKIIQGRLTVQQGLSQLGIKGQQLIQESITELDNPANAASTIERKGSSNPLLDTGEMRRAVTWEIDT